MGWLLVLFGLLAVGLLFCGLCLWRLFAVLLLLFEWWFGVWFVLSCAGCLSMVWVSDWYVDCCDWRVDCGYLRWGVVC